MLSLFWEMRQKVCKAFLLLRDHIATENGQKEEDPEEDENGI
jgi:hypothetical protein